MPECLYAVQDENGREAASWKGDVEKVSEVSSVVADSQVSILRGEEVLASGVAAEGSTYTLYRWPADDKLSDPVSHPVSEA